MTMIWQVADTPDVELNGDMISEQAFDSMIRSCKKQSTVIYKYSADKPAGLLLEVVRVTDPSTGKPALQAHIQMASKFLESEPDFLSLVANGFVDLGWTGMIIKFEELPDKARMYTELEIIALSFKPSLICKGK